MKKIFIYFINILFAFSGNAQDYIIKNEGDTVWGKVKISAKRIVIENSSGIIDFDSEDIAYVIQKGKSKIPLRLILYGYTDNIDVVQEPSYSDPVYDTTVLLNEIIYGPKMNLYTAKDKRGVDYFFVKRPLDDVAIQLLYKVGGDMPDKKNWSRHYQFVNYISKYTIFADQLRELTEDCPAITDNEIRNLVYLEYSLKKIVKKYNKKCSGL